MVSVWDTLTHRWGDPVRPDPHTTLRGCTRCGLCRVSRHENAEYWVEYERPDGVRVGEDGIPPRCPGRLVDA
jgi:hypothetical protein